MQQRDQKKPELTLANVMRDVCDSAYSENTMDQVNRLLNSVKHIEFPIRVVHFGDKIGLMFDVEYYYLDNEDDISRDRVMDWWLNECDHNTLVYEPFRTEVEAFVEERYSRLANALNQADNGIEAFFTTNESFVEFRVFVPADDVFKIPKIVDGVYDELSRLYSN